MRYPALVDHEPGLYGVAFPDLPGCATSGLTVEQALLNAEAAMREHTSQDDEVIFATPPRPERSSD